MALPKVPNDDARCRVDALFHALARGTRIGVAAIVLLGAPILVSAAYGQALSPNEALNQLTAQDIAESLLTLTSFTNDPGIGGAKLFVDTDPEQPKLEYSKASFRVDRHFWLPDRNLAIYGDIGFGFLDVDDQFIAQNALGEVVAFDADRNLYSGRIGVGVATKITDHIRIRPSVSGAYTRIESKTDFIGNLDAAQLPPVLALSLLDWKTDVWTIAGTLNAKYDRFWGEEEERFEVEFDYTFAYHESFNEDLDILSFTGTTDTLRALVRYSEPTGAEVFGLPLRWNALVEATAFPTIDKEDLGFKFYFAFGGGVDLVTNWRPLGFLIRTVGLRVNGFAGDNVTGFGISLSIRN